MCQPLGTHIYKWLKIHEPSAARKEGPGISKHFNEFSGAELGVRGWVREEKRSQSDGLRKCLDRFFNFYFKCVQSCWMCPVVPFKGPGAGEEST